MKGPSSVKGQNGQDFLTLNEGTKQRQGSKRPRFLDPWWRDQAASSVKTAKISWPLMKEPIGCTETLVTNYQQTPSDISEERSDVIHFAAEVWYHTPELVNRRVIFQSYFFWLPVPRLYAGLLRACWYSCTTSEVHESLTLLLVFGKQEEEQLPSLQQDKLPCLATNA